MQISICQLQLASYLLAIPSLLISRSKKPPAIASLLFLFSYLAIGNSLFANSKNLPSYLQFLLSLLQFLPCLSLFQKRSLGPLFRNLG
ncbi:MAG: hypothetical protein CFE21_02805 [Bacteroidetes bacterium B1(2017)]|nr:MAG: hypothetical protein CFE21_02805 [Bacteroidetes bacterium B1(2017)]